MNRKHLIAIATLAFAGAASAAGSPDTYGGTQPLAQTGLNTGGGLTREEVVADLNLWRASGLDDYAQAEISPDSLPGYAESVAQYQQLRTGPDFVNEVERLGGVVSEDQKVAVAYYNDGTPFYYTNY